MKKWWLALMVLVVYLLHQDCWNWKKVEPLVLGFLPVGLAYHAAYCVLASVMMAVLVKFAWPSCWMATFGWTEISRVCFESGGWLHPDTLYVFTTGRPESYVIPSEAEGGLAFWQALIERQLFDANLAIHSGCFGQ